MQESLLSNLSQGEMIQAVSIILILAYLIFNFTKKK
jgi:hypothetical protein